MKCQCINKIFDLSVTSMGPTRMVIEDQSVWMDDSGFDYGVTFDVNIKSLTARGINVTIPLAVNRRNILTAKELWGGNKDQCIKDDIYCFTVVSCGIPMSINRSFLPNAKCAVDALWGKKRDSKDEQTIDEINRLINTIESQIILDRGEQAKDTHKILRDKLKGLICECCN